VLTRRLPLRLLAPTLVVSLLLAGTCIIVALYLNRLHVDVSRDYVENTQSSQAAANLQTTATELRDLLRDKGRNPAMFVQQVDLYQHTLGQHLEESDKLANLAREKQLVAEIRDGLKGFRREWETRPDGRPAVGAGSDEALADLLDKRVVGPCKDLLAYNTQQAEQNDRDNYVIVNRLTWTLIAVGLGAPIVGLLLGYAMARKVYQSITQLSVRIRDAAGRLRKELPAVVLEDPSDLQALHRHMQGVLEEIENVVEQLQQREHEVLRAEQLAAVGQVAAGVAHELRNPLTSVKMLVQTGMEGDKPLGLPPDDLAIIEREIRRMESCIQTFLDFARPPSSERRVTDLNSVIRRALTLLDGRIRRRQVDVSLDLPAQPVDLLIDAEQIHQVVVNLLINALDVLPHGGEIKVEVSGPTEEQHSAIVRIQDTGPGLAPAVKHRLFEPFVTTKETGLGLGLSICKRLIEAHNGTIHAANGPEGGALFTFTLPADAVCGDASDAKPQAAMGTR
jgi:two-component system, NtrC family, sensor histidine kinase HydH